VQAPKKRCDKINPRRPRRIGQEHPIPGPAVLTQTIANRARSRPQLPEAKRRVKGLSLREEAKGELAFKLFCPRAEHIQQGACGWLSSCPFHYEPLAS
jgi:hypothetical protein